MSKQRKEEAKKKLKEKRAKAKVLAKREEIRQARRVERALEKEMKKKTGLPQEEILERIQANLKILEDLEKEISENEKANTVVNNEPVQSDI
jgi:hypothetical protein